MLNNESMACEDPRAWVTLSSEGQGEALNVILEHKKEQG